MLRIAHVISSPERIGGAERVLGTLVAAARTAGHEQLVLHPFAAHPERAELAGLVAPVRYSGRRARRVPELPRLRTWLGQQLDAFRPDVVHVHLFHAAALVASLPRRPGRRLLLTHHHGDTYTYGRHRAQLAVDRLLPRRFDMVAAVSGSVADFLVEDFGVPARRVRVVLNGWEGDPRRHVPEPDALRVVSVGNLRPAKGHLVLVDAFAEVARRAPAARLALVGDGPLRQEVEARVQALGLSGRVQLKGPVDDVWPELAAADIFVMPSHREPLGIAVLEAMAAGLPVVASRVGGLPELVEAGVNGELVPPGDPLALASAVLALEPAERRAAMGDAARAKAATLTAGHMADAYLALYSELGAP